MTKYTVIRDTREHEGNGWVFPASDKCNGTKIKKLDVGDYTLEGFENLFTIERKGSVTEFCRNLVEPRFVADYVNDKPIDKQSEFVRLEAIPYTFIILEFHFEDLLKYPNIPEVPPKLRSKIKFKGYMAVRKLNELAFKYKTKVLFCGNKGAEMASSLFKRFLDHHAKITSKVK